MLASAAIGLLFGFILLVLLLTSVPARADGGATMTVTADWLRFYCGESMDVTYRYIPDEVDTPLLRGYSVRIVAPNGLTFDEGDILVNSPLAGVFDTFMLIENGEGDYTIDFTFLETGVGLASPGVLFIITYRDQGIHIPTLVGIERACSARPRTRTSSWTSSTRPPWPGSVSPPGLRPSIRNPNSLPAPPTP